MWATALAISQPHLFEVVRGWAAVGEQDLQLDATKQSPARSAHVVISWGSLRLLPPRSQQAINRRPRARVGGAGVGSGATGGRGSAGVGEASLGANPDGGAGLGTGGLVSSALDRGGLSSRTQNGLSGRAATGAKLRGLAPLAGAVGPGSRTAVATASDSPADPRAAREPDAAY